METGNGSEFEIDWDTMKIRCRGVEVELEGDWMRQLRRKLGDPWCPNGDPVRQCPCWDLVMRNGDVTGYNLDVLDHVSTLTLEALCDSWVIGTFERSPWKDRDCVPLQVVETLWTEPLCSFDEMNGYGTDRVTWPIPLQDSVFGLALVLREWIEEPPDAKLATVLLERPETGAACADLAAEKRWNGLSWEADYGIWMGDELAQSTLLRYGLPATPTTSLFLLNHVGVPQARAFGDLIPRGPSRGIRVDSFGLLSFEPEVASNSLMVHRMEVNAAWSTDSLEREAAKAAKRHRRWWASLPHTKAAYADLRKFNRPSDDPLAPLVKECGAGSLSRDALYQRAYDHYQPATPVEKSRVRKMINSRLSRLKMRMDPR